MTLGSAGLGMVANLGVFREELSKKDIRSLGLMEAAAKGKLDMKNHV